MGKKKDPIASDAKSRFSEEDMTVIVIPARQLALAGASVVTSVIDYVKKNSINNEKAVRQSVMDFSDELINFFKEPTDG